jgi:amino-acid N-acetyltransferase
MKQRKATMQDIPALLGLINGYASDGLMLPQTEFEMAEKIRDFTVIEADTGPLLACGALHFYTPTVGEVRSLAVDAQAHGQGLGSQVLAALEHEARQCRLDTVFAFTYVPAFFRKMGYVAVDRSELPLKVWKDCMRCPKFQCCDELALVKYLDGKDGRRAGTHGAQVPEKEIIQLPVIKS